MKGYNEIINEARIKELDLIIAGIKFRKRFLRIPLIGGNKELVEKLTEKIDDENDSWESKNDTIL